MLEIFLHYLILLIIISTNGFIFKKFIIGKNIINLNFFEYSIIGLIVTGFLAQIINFFFPLKDIIIYINFFFGIFVIFFYKKEFKFNHNLTSKILILTIFILSLVNIYGSGFSDDLNHYHGGSIGNADNINYIIGSNFLHSHYGYSSIWLILHSYLNFNNTFLQDIHIMNGLIFFLILAYFLSENNENSNKSKNQLLYLISSIIIFYLLIKFTRLKEFGLDRPGILIFCFLLYFSAKYSKLIDVNYKVANNFLFIILIVCLFLVSIKIFFISSFLIPLFFLIKSNSINYLISKKLFVFYLLCLIYLLKNFLISGCLIYPFEFTCISNLPWNSKDIVSDLLIGAEAASKSFSLYSGELSISEYIKNFNWIDTWFERNFEELRNYLFSITFVIILFFLSSKSKKLKLNLNYYEYLILALLIVNILIFIKSPVFRFHHVMLVLLGLGFCILTNRFFEKNTKIFKISLIILLVFNFSKNFLRIIESNFVNDPYRHIKEINWYQSPIKQQLGSFTYYSGWIGSYPVGNSNLDGYKHTKKFGFNIIYK